MRARIAARVVASAVVVFAASIGYRAWRGDALPESLVGTWSAPDATHAGRILWLTPTDIAFRTGGRSTDLSIHRIRKVKTRTVADTLFADIDYDAGGSPSTLSLEYRASAGSEIRLAHDPEVRWVRTGPAPSIGR